MSRCLSSSAYPEAGNVTVNAAVAAILQQRYDDGSEEERLRLRKCWGYDDCGDCHRSDGACGWCALSNTCLPLPRGDRFSRTFPLLSPIRHAHICPLTRPSERYELRTRGLGCQVSTITLLTSIVTIFSTIAALLVFYGLWKLIKVIVWSVWAKKGGWKVEEFDGESGMRERTEGVWIRSGESWGVWWRRMIGTQREEEVRVVDGGSGERGWWWWRVLTGRGSAEVEREEIRPLLG